MRTFKNLTENVQEAITMPYGTDFNRPANPEEGMVRYNTTQDALEFYNGTSWYKIGDDAVTPATPSIITDSLVINVDAADSSSYSGSGSTWTDLSQGGNNLTINGATYDSNGFFSFDGSNDTLTSSFNPSISSNKEYTFEFWIKLSSSPSAFQYTQAIATDYNASAPYVMMGIRGSSDSSHGGKLDHWERNTGGTEVGNRYHGQTYFDDAWHNITYVADSTDLRMYVDGTAVANTSRPGGTVNSSSNFSFMTGNGTYVKGDLASIRVYLDKALSSTEVTQNFNAKKSTFGL